MLHLLHVQDVEKFICGGKIRRSGIQTCVTPTLAEYSTYDICNHATKADILLKEHLFCQDTIMCGLKRNNLVPSKDSSSVTRKLLETILDLERLFDSWSTSMPRLVSILLTEVMVFFNLVNNSVANMDNHLTPH